MTDNIETKYIANLSNGTDTYAIKDAEARTALANKQDTLISGTNIKTINNNSILGSGDIIIDSLPSQSGQSGKYLTTDGSSASWTTPPSKLEWAEYGVTTFQQINTWVAADKVVYINDAGSIYKLEVIRNSNDQQDCTFKCLGGIDQTQSEAIIKCIQVDGSNTWSRYTDHYQLRIPAGTAGQAITYTGIAGNLGSADIPVITDTYDADSSEGMSGKAVADAVAVKQNALVSGVNIKTINDQSILGSGNLEIQGGSGDIDDITITTNSESKIQAEGLIEKNSGTAKYDWVGTLEEYEALETHNTNWIYYITDDNLSSTGLDELSVTKNSSNNIQTIGVINQANNTEAIKVWTGTEAEYNTLREEGSWFGWTVGTTKYYTQSELPSPGDRVFDENLDPLPYIIQTATTSNITIIYSDESES